MDAKEQLANLLFNIMVQEARVYEGLRVQFVQWFMETDEHGFAGKEFRVGGLMGFGGKFWRNAGKFYVSCYTEDETPKIRKAMNRINKLLEGV